jgi:hypothetical protein
MSTFQTKMERIFWWTAVGFGVALIAAIFHIISLQRTIQDNAKSCECECYINGYQSALEDIEVLSQPTVRRSRENY